MGSRKGKGGSSASAVLEPALQLITEGLLLLLAFVGLGHGAFLSLPLEESLLTLEKHPISEA